jgi:HK97 family phage major capsid protein
MTPNDLLEKRAKLIADARALVDKAEKEKREPTAEERAAFDKMMNDADAIKADADRMKKLEDEERKLTEPQPEHKPGLQKTGEPEKPQVIELRKSVCGETRNVALTGERAKPEYHSAFRSYLLHGDRAMEYRALQKDNDEAGGYLSASEQFNAELIRDRDNMTFMRQICRVLPPLATADSIGTPSLDADPADPTWVSELAIGSEDSTMDFGKRALTPHPLAQYIKVSKTLLRRSTIGVDAIVRERLAYKQAVVMENAYLNGNGSNQPLGVFTASDNGISTGRDVSTGNSATAIAADNLFECVYTLPAQWRNNLAWIFHRTAIKNIRMLKDGEGRYIWAPGITAGEQDTILGYPVYESEYAPSTFESGKYVGIIGNFQYYWIVDALSTQIQVLLELYAATNQNGYIIRSESDGMPVLENAFVRVTLG